MKRENRLAIFHRFVKIDISSSCFTCTWQLTFRHSPFEGHSCRPRNFISSHKRTPQNELYKALVIVDNSNPLHQ